LVVPPDRSVLACQLTFFYLPRPYDTALTFLAGQPGGHPLGHTVTFDPRRRRLTIYHRGFYLGLASEPPPFAYHCGRLNGPWDPLKYGERGYLGLRPVAFGSAGAVLAWWPLPSRLTLYLVLATTETELDKEAAWAQQTGLPWLRESEAAACRARLARAYCPVPETLSVSAQRPGPSRIRELYRRSLLVLNLLQDQTGAVIAAPEVDPEFVRSGGYAYTWSRDAVYIVWALARAGFPETADRYYAFASRVQSPDGLWDQRHYASGHVAPSWGRQLDETGTLLWGMGQHYRLTKDRRFLARQWPSVRAAAQALLALVSSRTEPPPSLDLWEERRGQHAYTWASLAAGLEEAAYLAQEFGEPYLARRCRETGAWLAEAALERFWDEKRGCFYRTLREPGRKVDISLLGLVFPFGILDPRDPRAEATVRAITQELAAGYGYYRYPRDRYSRDRVWPLAGLWLSIVWHLMDKPELAQKLLYRAAQLANSLGLFPEQAFAQSAKPAWVVPLGWAHAMFLLAVQVIFGHK
jgi:oligosaccharide amylase